MAEWPHSDPTYKAFQRYFGELQPFKDDDPKRRMRAGALRGAFSIYKRHSSLRSPSKALITTATGYNQALVKIIPKGGARSAQGLRDQVAYLTRQHTLKMADGDLGEIGGDLEKHEANAKAEDWAEDFRGNPKFGHTTHIVVSFPKGTDTHAAIKAGEAFAKRALSEGMGGDCFDYMTIQHTDTDYPHTHILVKNRGMYEGAWFTIKRGSAHEPSELRRLQSDVSAQFGIRLSATTRLERGIKEKPILTPEFRQAKAEGRVPRPEPMTPQEEAVLEILIDERADAYASVADTLKETHGELQNALMRASELLKQGDIIVPKSMPLDIDEKTTDELLETLDREKAELSKRLSRADETLKRIKDPIKRADLEARLGVEKGLSAKHFPERKDLQLFARGENIETYSEGFQFERRGDLKAAHDEIIRASYERAAQDIRTRAGDVGVDADAVLARYKVSGSVRHETAKRWYLEDLRDVTQKMPGLEPDEARQSVGKLHAYVRDTLLKANQNIVAALRARDVQVSMKDTPLPEHALRPFEEILAKPKPRPKPTDTIKPRTLRPGP